MEVTYTRESAIVCGSNLDYGVRTSMVFGDSMSRRKGLGRASGSEKAMVLKWLKRRSFKHGT